MFLLAGFFSDYDLLLAPLCFIILYAFHRGSNSGVREPHLRKLYSAAFFYKMLFVLLYTLVVEFYFKGGDTGLYFQGVKDLRNALDDDPELLGTVIKTFGLSPDNPLFPYFFYDDYKNDLTYYYMVSPSNFFVPRLGLLPSFIFFNSYFCINLCFGFFALKGSIRLFKTFYHYYPGSWREIALAILFLPSLVFWSSGLLKDTITFGAIGFVLYGILNIFIRKRKVFVSVIAVLIGGFLLYHIKIYILLALVLGIMIWLFAETNKLIQDMTLRRVFAFMTFIASILIAIFMIEYFTSAEAARDYSLDALLERSEEQRAVYAYLATQNEGSFFTINASNPVSLVFNSIVATFFRPFLWEVTTPMVLFSALEALALFYLTLNFMIKRGIKKFFSIPFSEPRLLMCFVFSMIFAIAIGSSTTNFGALSRYKIPCIPFFIIMVLLTYRKAALPYPKWFNKILSYIQPESKPHVRPRRIHTS